MAEYSKIGAVEEWVDMVSELFKVIVARGMKLPGDVNFSCPAREIGIK